MTTNCPQRHIQVNILQIILPHPSEPDAAWRFFRHAAKNLIRKTSLYDASVVKNDLPVKPVKMPRPITAL
jgi:hypothetical protein